MTGQSGGAAGDEDSEETRGLACDVECIFIREPAESCRGRDIALLVGFAPDGRPSPALVDLSKQLSSFSLAVHVFLAVTSQDVEVDVSELGTASSISIRPNDSYDFGVWSAALCALDDVWAARSILFVNDSVLICNIDDFDRMMTRLSENECDFVALTENNSPTHHTQSYFFRLKGGALVDAGLRDFWARIPAGMGKKEVISGCELKLLDTVKRNEALSIDILFGFSRIFDGCEDLPPVRNNPTHELWERLLLKGLPFVKAELLYRNPKRVHIGHWRHVVREAGGDLEFFERHLAEMRRVRAGTATKVRQRSTNALNRFLSGVLGEARFERLRGWNRERRRRRRARRQANG